ncbi:MAG: uroporphyrinogen-III C-methyltransferase [Proteobacteria bacterium]|nr:uroporphyrinogen-III C-methyltransferase [Pseudomonadota bacterium]
MPADPAAAIPVRQRGAANAWGVALAFIVLVAGLVGVGWLAWHAERRVQRVEQELVQRQQESAEHATEARTLARQAEDTARETAAKVALLDARVAEVAVQRSQLEDLIQSLSRSRDENLLVDIDAALRVALQQTSITGSAEPLVAALKQSDDRLAHYDEPRLQGVRRAIARDLDRVKTASVADIGALSIKLDEATRMVDDLPLVASPEARSKEPARATPMPAAASRPASAPASAAQAAASSPANAISRWWEEHVESAWGDVGSRIWGEARSLVRVTRIEHPESMLIAPDQAYFLRENLKLRLLNARLALLSRQFDTAQADLQVARASLDRYFDRSAKRTMAATELIRQVASQARQVAVPRPDDTLAALAAASGGR